MALRSNRPNIRHVRFRRWSAFFACVIAGLACFYLYESYSASSVSTPAIDLSDVHPDVARGIGSAVQVVNSRPASGLGWGHLGMTLWAHEYTSEALLCFAQAQRLSPNEVRWPYFQGIILVSDDRKAATAAFSTAVTCDPGQPQPWVKLCEILLETDQLDEASIALNRLLELAPNNAQAYLLAAILADRQGRLDRAIEHGRRSLELAPDHARVISLLARLLNRNQHRDEAAALNARLRNSATLHDGWPDALFEEMSSFRLDPYWSAYKAKRLIERGDDQHGLSLLRTLVNQFPNAPAIRAQLSRTLLKRGMTNQAMTCLMEATDDSPFELRLLRATTHLMLEEWEKAEAMYRQLVALKPDSPSLLSEFAFCLRQQDRPNEALLPAQQAVSLAPDQITYRIELVHILTRLNRLQQAHQELTIVEKLDPAEDDIPLLRQAIDDASGS